jgi:putative transposase
MTHYNPLKHHRRSIRLKGFDYSQSGLYFITICCQNMISRFGEVQNGRMILNQFGEIAHHEWEKTPEIRNNIALGEFIIMPNHMHGIIQILDTGELHSPLEKKSECDSPSGKKGECHSPQRDSPLSGPSNNIGAVVRGYKSAVTRQISLLGFTQKLWLRNYYEHIIRDELSHQRISNYIKNNPSNWKKDKFY